MDSSSNVVPPPFHTHNAPQYMTTSHHPPGLPPVQLQAGRALHHPIPTQARSSRVVGGYTSFGLGARPNLFHHIPSIHGPSPLSPASSSSSSSSSSIKHPPVSSSHHQSVGNGKGTCPPPQPSSTVSPPRPRRQHDRIGTESRPKSAPLPHKPLEIICPMCAQSVVAHPSPKRRGPGLNETFSSTTPSPSTPPFPLSHMEKGMHGEEELVLGYSIIPDTQITPLVADQFQDLGAGSYWYTDKSTACAVGRLSYGESFHLVQGSIRPELLSCYAQAPRQTFTSSPLATRLALFRLLVSPNPMLAPPPSLFPLCILSLLAPIPIVQASCGREVLDSPGPFGWGRQIKLGVAMGPMIRMVHLMEEL